MAANPLYVVYQKSLAENEKNITFWEGYLKDLKALQFNVYNEQLTVPVLVPLGSKIMFRGELKHTNEVTVALGADYFAKCTVHHAEVLRQHRMNDAITKLDSFKKERDFLLSQMSFKTGNETSGHDIMETFTEEEDKAWRKQHRENLRQYKQRKDKIDETPSNEIADEELWNRLEELELQEELENELSENSVTNKNNVVKDLAQLENAGGDENCDDESNKNEEEKLKNPVKSYKMFQDEIYSAHCHGKLKISPHGSKLHLLERVVANHKMLENLEREFHGSTMAYPYRKMYQDEISKQGRMEEFKNEIEMYQNKRKEPKQAKTSKKRKSVTFAVQDDSETLMLTFNHSDVEPASTLYDPENGIMKPSDIYEVYTNINIDEASSILKKINCTKEGSSAEPSNIINKGDVQVIQEQSKREKESNHTIVLKDIIEKENCTNNEANDDETLRRDLSYFRKKWEQLQNM